MRASFPDGLSGTICRDRRTQANSLTVPLMQFSMYANENPPSKKSLIINIHKTSDIPCLIRLRCGAGVQRVARAASPRGPPRPLRSFRSQIAFKHLSRHPTPRRTTPEKKPTSLLANLPIMQS